MRLGRPVLVWLPIEDQREFNILVKGVNYMSVDKKNNKKWEVRNSLWIILAFIPIITSWIAFLYIGIKTKRYRWIFWGIVYFFIMVLFLGVMISDPKSPVASMPILSSVILIGFISYIVGVVYASNIRKEYLIRLEVIENSNSEENLRKRIEEEYAKRG